MIGTAALKPEPNGVHPKPVDKHPCLACSCARGTEDFHLLRLRDDLAVCPLCEPCWVRMSLKRRLKWVGVLTDRWLMNSRTDEERRAVEALAELAKAAVMRGG